MDALLQMRNAVDIGFNLGRGVPAPTSTSSYFRHVPHAFTGSAWDSHDYGCGGSHGHCAQCGRIFEMDNCDGDVDDYGRQVVYVGSSLGFQCEHCDEWVCNDCGDRDADECMDCARYTLTVAGYDALTLPRPAAKVA